MHEIKSEGTLYTLNRLVGEGRTASVYKALRRDSRHNVSQTVALKILKNKTTVPWLRREFQTLTQIQSEHCVRILGWDNLPEGPALVLEWIEGISLLQLGRARVLSPSIVTEIIAQVQLGLITLQKAGFHHGDLSPANILIDETGVVKIVDFATAHHEPGVIHGTPAYIAPELWKSSPSNLQSDLFALGMIELDLLEQFQFVPRDHQTCRSRAEQAMVTLSPLLHPTPHQRTFKQLTSMPESQNELARIVRGILSEQSLAMLKTASMDAIRTNVPAVISFRPRIYRHLRSLIDHRGEAFITGLCLLISAVPVKAVAPLADQSQEVAALLVRSHRWLEIEINGQKAGYAPLEIRSLRPGPHRITWKSAFGSGERRIWLKPAESRYIIDKDFR